MKRSIFYGIKSIHTKQYKVYLFPTVFSVPAQQLILLIHRPFHACDAVCDKVHISRTTYSKQYNALRNQDIMAHAEEIIAMKDMKRRIESMNELTKRVIDTSSSIIILHLLYCSSKKRLKMTFQNIVDVTVALRNDKKLISIIPLTKGLMSLKSFKCRSKEELNLLSILTEKLKQCKEPFSAQAIGNALYGMQGMSSEYEEVRILLRALCGKVSL